MAELKCEYPEGCRLDLWAKVIKAKYIEKQAKVMEVFECIPLYPRDEWGDGCYVNMIDDFKVKVVRAEEILNFNRVKILIEFDVTLFVILEDGSYQVYNMPGNIYEQTIELDQFDPPLSVEEFRNEIDDSDIILCNWTFDYEIKGACEDPCGPCYPLMEGMDCPINRGTCVYLVVYVDIIDKLGKMHDIIVYGELDPEVDC